jgi:hypothetical protein
MNLTRVYDFMQILQIKMSYSTKDFSCTPRSALDSTRACTAPTSQLYPLHYLCRSRAARESSALPLHQQSLPVKVVPVAPSVNPHPMTTWAKQGFRLPTNRLTLSATSTSSLSSVPSSVHAALIDLNWHRAMEEEFAALIANNTWDLVS